VNRPGVQRVASVIGLPEEHREEYERHHAAVWPVVLDLLTRHHVTNYSIHRHGELLFSYYEYAGDDHERDMAALAAHPEVQRWWSLQEPLQRPLDDRAPGEWWKRLPEVFHLD
jgi:L-rhamnose mutarotase